VKRAAAAAVDGHSELNTIARMATYRAIIQQDGPWWIGWIEEIPGVNSQGHTREELLENLRSAIEEALEMNDAVN
jgi:predicted RNase H-like HicB family nuclease